MTMTSADVAREIGTEPKVLRRFLRADPTYINVGSGGRYDFQPSDIPALKRAFEKWAHGKRTAAMRKPRGMTVAAAVKSGHISQAEQDALVWAEEEADRAAKGLGPIEVPRTPTQQMRQAALQQTRELQSRLRIIGRSIEMMAGPGGRDGQRSEYIGPYERKTRGLV